MRTKERIKELEKQVKFLMQNATYKKTVIMIEPFARHFSMYSGNQYIKYIYKGEIKRTGTFGHCLFIVKDEEDTCLVNDWSRLVKNKEFYLLNKKDNTLTKLPCDYKPTLEVVKGKNLIIDGKKFNCTYERTKTSENPLIYELKVFGDRKKLLDRIIFNSSCFIKFEDILKPIEFYLPQSEMELVSTMQKECQNITINFISTQC